MRISSFDLTYQLLFFFFPAASDYLYFLFFSVSFLFKTHELVHNSIRLSIVWKLFSFGGGGGRFPLHICLLCQSVFSSALHFTLPFSPEVQLQSRYFAVYFSVYFRLSLLWPIRHVPFPTVNPSATLTNVIPSLSPMLLFLSLLHYL